MSKEVKISVNDDMAKALEAAMKSGRWIICLGYVTADDNKIDIYQTRLYPYADIPTSFEEWKKQVEEKEGGKVNFDAKVIEAKEGNWK